MPASTNPLKVRLILERFHNSPLPSIEIYVAELGWLILLRENIELVSDNWFSSAKYIASELVASGDSGAIMCKNIYKVNVSHAENANNPKYNLLYNDLTIFVDNIIAFN